MLMSRAAQHVGVKQSTLLFYERRGLVRPVRRSSGYREYSADDLVRLRFIRRAAELGFSLREITELLAASDARDVSSRKVRRAAEAKLAELDARLTDLGRMRRAIRRVLAAPAHDGPCPILASLARRPA